MSLIDAVPDVQQQTKHTQSLLSKEDKAYKHKAIICL